MFRVHLLIRLPNLRAWGMKTLIWGSGLRLSFHRSVLLCYRTYGRHIQSLELARIDMQDVSHFSGLVSAFTSLRSLTCSEILLPSRKEHQTPSHDAEILTRLAKPLKIQRLSVSILITCYVTYGTGS